MNSDFRIPTNFFQSRLAQQITKRLGPDGIVCLLKLYSWVATQAWTGVLHGDIQALEHHAMWDGEPGAFAGLLIELNELAETEDGLILVNWADQQPYCVDATERSERARHAAKARWRKRA